MVVVVMAEVGTIGEARWMELESVHGEAEGRVYRCKVLWTTERYCGNVIVDNRTNKGIVVTKVL